MKFYFTPQGGSFANANTIWFWPALALSQVQEGWEDDGKRYHWIATCSWLFWTAGLQW